MLSKLIRVCLFLGVLTGQASADDAGAWIEDARDNLAQVEKLLDREDKSLAGARGLAQHRKKVVSVNSRAKTCVDEYTASVQSLQERRTSLGDAAAGEDVEVARLRRELDNEIAANDRQRAACEQITQVSMALLEQISQLQKAALRDRLFARGIPVSHVLQQSLGNPLAWSRLVSGFFDEDAGWGRLSPSQKWSQGGAVLFALLATFVYVRKTRSRRKHSRRAQIIAASLPWIFATGVACLFLINYLPQWPPATITRLVLGLLVWLLVFLMLRIWLLNRRSMGLSGKDAGSLLLWLSVLSGLLLAGWLIITAEAATQLSDAHYFTLRLAMVWLMVVGVLWTAILLGRVPGLAGTQHLRALMVIVALVIAIAETSGYRHLSLYLLVGFGGTALGLIVVKGLVRFMTMLYDGLDDARYQWIKDIRRGIGLKGKEPIPGLVWLRLATTLLLWSMFIVWTLWVWGQSERWLVEIRQYAVSGFDAGSLHIEPFRILGAIAVLAIGITLSRWFKEGLVGELVRKSRLDRGGREAVITLSGYFGVLLSVLIAVGIAGISFTHLAIIAGALSVGIGFGLQNVVNNFVSGLILLFERPIRTGDWVVVGDTHGYVRKISIRSTQIETFDRADVIVPNSELIAQKVSNLMLRDPWGRIKLPVGVAYGSDVEKVTEVLEEVANAHEGVLKDQPGLQSPRALFLRFGDSALEFELRCFIRQIDRVFEITHELNMAIDRRFREEGITIPFPQRDVYIKSEPPTDAGD